MPKTSVSETVGGMFDDLKSKLGFNRDDDGYDNRRDDYDEYSDFDEYSEYGDDYGDTHRDDHRESEPVGGYRPYSAQISGKMRENRYASSDISSSLVSIDDVKMSTPLPDLDDLDSRDHAEPSSYVPAYKPMGASTGSSFGSATAGAPPTTYAPASGIGVSASAGAGSYDPYEAYSSADSTAHAPVRTLTVVKPATYGDVERVARAVKSGDVVVLAMRYTPDDLSKRILDFSFGVASALDANVECPGEKVFAIARGNALTEDEKRRLGAQGVL